LSKLVNCEWGGWLTCSTPHARLTELREMTSADDGARRATRAKKASKRVKASTSSKAAPGAALGFSLQVTRLLARLLSDCSIGDSVSLEVFEDVGVWVSDGTVIAEQNKSTHGKNPLSDRAVALWKTLRNWLEAVNLGVLDPRKTRFVLYVSSPVALGALARRFVEADNLLSAHEAVAAARDELWGSAPGFLGRSSVAVELVPLLDYLFDQADGVRLGEVVAQMEITLGTGSPHSDLRPLLREKLVSEDALEDVLRWALGWVKAETDRLLERGEAAHVSYDAFHGALLEYVRRHDRTDILRSFAGTPSESEVAVERNLRTYVRQLEIVGAEEEDILSAINDHLRAIAERTHWAERGHVDPPMFDVFETELRRAWKNMRDRAELAYSALQPKARGRLVFLDCNAHAARLNSLECPAHFTRGSFHTLADTKTIGWHPEYMSELSRKGIGPK
jgi:hypothetical protein